MKWESVPSSELSEIDADLFISGHEAGVVSADEFRKRLPDYLGIIDQRILENHDQPRTPAELIRRGIMYSPRSVSNEWIVHWERAHIEKHLVCMERQGRVEQIEGQRYYRRGKPQ